MNPPMPRGKLNPNPPIAVFAGIRPPQIKFVADPHPANPLPALYRRTAAMVAELFVASM